MIRDVALWEAWEREYERTHLPDYERNTALLEAMYWHARSLGAFPLADPLADIDVKIRLAQAFNVRTSAGTNRSRS